MKNFITLSTILFFSSPCFSQTPQSLHIDSVTAIKTWEIHKHGVHFSLTQILAEQAQAFYVNRGFTLKQIQPYTSSCVYMTVLRNDSAPGSIHFISNNWSVIFNDKPHPLTSVNNWLQHLSENNINKAALLAFRWAQFPPEQEYAPGGDWNQGMLSIGLAAGSQFDITARWDINGKKYASTLKGVQCAE